MGATRLTLLLILTAGALLVGGCASRRPAAGPTPAGPAVVGFATYYGQAFHGRTTASGVPFDMRAMVAAHPTHPFGTLVRVTHLGNGRSVQVRIVDRGPAAGPRAAGVIIDLSQAAAEALDFVQAGRARVRVEVVRGR